MKELTFDMPLFWILGEDGKTPVTTDDVMVWGACMQDAPRKHVGWDWDNAKAITVSTVFLGLDHGMFSDKPILFETMIFSSTRSEIYQRYSTWEDAERGHIAACELAGITRRLTSWTEGEIVPDNLPLLGGPQ